MRRKQSRFSRLILAAAAATILFPLALIALWSVSSVWEWPGVLPGGFSLRGYETVFADYQQMPRLLLFSAELSLAVAALSTLVGLMTARAIALYRFPGRKLLLFGTMLPILVPSTVFGMGAHVLLIRAGLAGTLRGVILMQTVCALPYTVNILTDLTSSVGDGLEEQAQVLGCPPWRAFWAVSLPELLPGILSAMSMAYIISYSQYFLTLLIGGGRVRTLSTVMVPFLTGGDRTVAATYAVTFLFSVLAMYLVFEGLIRLMARGKGSEPWNWN